MLCLSGFVVAGGLTSDSHAPIALRCAARCCPQVLEPIERMVEKVKEMTDNPLLAGADIRLVPKIQLSSAPLLRPDSWEASP